MGQLATHEALLNPNTMPERCALPLLRTHELLKDSKLKLRLLICHLSWDNCCTKHHTLLVVYRSLKAKPKHGLDLLVGLRIYALLNVRKNGPFRRYLISAKVNCPKS